MNALTAARPRRPGSPPVPPLPAGPWAVPLLEPVGRADQIHPLDLPAETPPDGAAFPTHPDDPPLPRQGAWTEAEFYEQTDGTNRRLEFDDGRLEFLPMPDQIHMDVQDYLYRLLYAHVQGLPDPGRARVNSAGINVRVRPTPPRTRLPDVCVMLAGHADRRHGNYWDGADLVVEIVTDTSRHRRRDEVDKRIQYAETGVPEYWIVDPARGTFAVLVLPPGGGAYEERGPFRPGETAASELLPGLTVDVAACLAAGEEEE